ncbi:hypothetical protein FQA39_LY15619 [Lamprigera yunnana]|nr:hypothetical protein FQA39_LY15619 [Lamprigera yunnana]
MNPENFARDVRDGSIIARILRNYNIITEEQRLKVIQGDDPNVNYKNFKYIRVWLNAIGITCTDEDVSEISKGKCLSAIKLFYQIYLALHDKDELYYTSKRRGNERLHPTDTRFEVVSVNETTEKDFVDFTDNPFCEQLTLQRDTIEWNKERYEELESAYKTMRERYTMYLQQKFGVKYVNKFEKSFAIKHTTSNLEELNEPDVEDDKDYDELMKLVQDFKKKPTFKENANVSASILTKLKIKRRQEVKDNEIKVQQQKFMLMELWKKLLEEQGKELETEISKKMLKQSVFEKQMSTKMFEVRQQKDNIMQNCKCINDEILRRREEEFMEHVFLRNKCAPDQKDNYYFEKYRMLELHRRLYAEKQRLKSEREMKMCTDVVKYLVDLSIRYSEYKDEHKIEPCRCVMKEWVNLFIKDQPLTPYMDDLTDLTVDTEIPEDAEEIFYLEFYRQEALDEREFEDYMNLEWPWELDQLLPHLRSNLLDIELGMNVLGHGVHRVLYKLYPSRLPLPKPDIPLVNVAVCINGLPNLSVLPVMQKLLLKKKIQIIEMRDVINSGLQAYKDEMKMQDVDIVLISETQTTLDKSHKKKKSELLKKGTKSSQGSHKQRTPATITFEVKETQTPAIYPCEEMQLTRRGELGKMAYETLNVGDELTDNLMIAMFIEYLKTFTDVNGWALINYPTNFSQAALLEEALNGVPIPNISDILKNEASPSIGDVSDLNYRSSVFGLEEKNARLRTSKLVPNPETVYENDSYNTYLTAYIKIEHQSARDKSKGEDVVESPLDQNFVFVLQDIIVQDTEDGKKPLVPKLWQMLNPCEVEQLSKLMFGDVEFINWRDFIIYNFGISFPTIESILKVRAAFREKDPNVSEVITGCQFFSTKLWFENECEQENREGMLRLCLIKQLLFKLYKVGENILNYTALLLDFCKSDTAEKGFTKALALAFGKEVCQDVILGDIYIASIKEQLFIDERMEQMKQVEDEEILKCVESVVSSLINAAVDSCDSIVIESIPNPYPCEVAEEMRNLNEISLKSEEEEEEEEEEGDEQEEEEEQNHIEVPCKKISKFSNIGIDYQPHYNTNYIYLLDFESVCSILTATLPWHARAQTVYDRSIRECLETIYDLLKDSKLNNSVWAHVLLNDKSFKRLLMRSSKFVEKFPIEIVIKLLGCNEMQCV